MESTPPQPITRADTVTDLKAAVEARRELSGDLEDHVLEAFLARVQERIDGQVRQHLAEAGVNRPPVHRRQYGGWVLPASLGVCIPLVAIAGAAGGVWGILVVMIAVIALTAIYLDYDKRDKD